MKDKKGFTLIELLAVFTILGIILVIAIVSMINIGKSKKTESWESTKIEVENAAKDYFENNQYIFNEVTAKNNNAGNVEGWYISVGSLVIDDYLNKVTNPITGKAVSDCDIVFVTKTDNGYNYKYMTKDVAEEYGYTTTSSCIMDEARVVYDINVEEPTPITPEPVIPSSTTTTTTTTTAKKTTTTTKKTTTTTKKTTTTTKKTTTTTKKTTTTSVCTGFTNAKVKNISNYISVSVSGRDLLNSNLYDVNGSHKEYNRVRFTFDGKKDGDKIKFDSSVAASWSSKSRIEKTTWHNGWNSSSINESKVTKDTWCVTKYDCYSGSHSTFYVTACAYAKCGSTKRTICYSATAYRSKKAAAYGFTYVGK